jgi:TRAP-type transport system small permease protein
MNAPPSRAGRVLVFAGGVALLAAMVVDALAVLGRHVGLPLLGSIELVQAAVLLSGSVSLLMATLGATHARVHLLVDRLPAPVRAVLTRLGLGLGALLFAALLVASSWIARDLWNGHEESELLGLAYRPLRVFIVVATASVALTFLAQALSRRRP